MAIEQVKKFYQRLASDEVFRSQIQAVKSKEECSQIVKTAGFIFTQQEFEDYTSQLLEAEPSESELQDLNEKELEAVFGGGKIRLPGFPPRDGWVIKPLYGGVIIEPIEPIHPIYGSPIPKEWL